MNILEALGLIDWLTPIRKLVEDIDRGGPINLKAWTFFIPHGAAIRAGWSQAHIEGLLRDNGIQFWASWAAFGEYQFTVNRQDASRVEKMLSDLGIPIHPRSRGA